MKKVFTLFAAALMATATYAQVVMVDPAGKEYANGSTMVINGEEEDEEIIFKAPSLKNKGSETVSVKLGIDIKSLPAYTSVMQCFNVNCFNYDKVGLQESPVNQLAAGQTLTTATEWSCYDYMEDNYSQSECVIEFTIYVNNVAGDKVTVIYSNSTTRLESANHDVKVESSYTMLGQKASAGQKGIVVQKMSDGSVRKVIVM